jgi:hypothetical protein
MQSSRQWQKRVKPARIPQAVDRAAGLASRLTHQSINVIARSACDEAIHAVDRRKLDCFASLAMTLRSMNDKILALREELQRKVDSNVRVDLALKTIDDFLAELKLR